MTAENSPQPPSEHDPWEAIGAGAEPADDRTGVADPGSDEQANCSRSGVTDGADIRALAVIPRAPAPVQPISTYTGSGWTIPLLCLGLGLIACCVLIPQADVNRRLAYQRQSLQADLASVKQQARINALFLNRVADDPALAERLAERQMKVIPAGTKILPLDNALPGSDDEGAAPAQGSAAVGGVGGQGADMSPFQIIAVALPPTPPPYRPIGGTLANICNNPRSRLYLTGAALLAVAAGLVFGQARW